DALALGRAHPELDLRLPAALTGVEPVQLTPVRMGPCRQHFDLHLRKAHRFGERVDQLAAGALGGGPLLGVQRGLERGDARPKRGRVLETDLDERVALAIDGLLRAGESRVVRERHRYWPVKRGFLFSRNALAPSIRSSVVRRRVARSFSSRSPSSSGRPSP